MLRPRFLMAAALAATMSGPALPHASAQQAKAPARPAAIDLNSATKAQLESLPGVGETISAKIIAGRPYRSVNDLARIGLNPAAIETLRPLTSVGAPAAVAGGPSAPPVDLNNAPIAEIEALPGVGPALARSIVEGRPYADLSELDKVKGIGPARLEQLRPLVRVGNPGATTRLAARPATPADAAKKPAAAKGAASGAPIHLNKATQAELESLPGIGPVKARAIIEGRPFKTIDSIKDVKGIGEKTFDQIRGRLTID